MPKVVFTPNVQRHVACPEDGELIDAPAQAPHQHARQAGETRALFPESRLPFLPGDAGHDHCAIAAQARANARPAGVATVLHPAPRVGVMQFRKPELRSLGSLAIYRLAPKASPPQA